MTAIHKPTVRKLTTGALMTAVIFFATWLLRIPVPVSGGAYMNFGDTAIFLCAYIVGGPPAAAAAACGSGLADLTAGAVVYILPTMAIKALTAFAAGRIMYSRTFAGYFLGCLAGGAVMTGGYFLFEYFFFGAAMAAVSLPFNLLQYGGSVLTACLLYEAARRLAQEERKRGRS